MGPRRTRCATTSSSASITSIAAIAGALASMAVGTLGALAVACTGRLGERLDAPPLVVPRPARDEPTCTAVEPGPAPIRKLTRFEYDNTVRDLLGDTTSPAREFPPEEEVLGFTNNARIAGVTPLLGEHYMVAAERLATAAVARMEQLLPCRLTIGIDACARMFIERFGGRAFRRPLDAEEAAAFFALFDARKKSDGFIAGVRAVVEALLQSPQFLYRVEMAETARTGAREREGAATTLGAYEMASRLSYLLWGSMPDDVLFAAAAEGRLSREADLIAQAERMIRDPRARAMVAEFHSEWLELHRIENVTKTAAAYPSFDPALRDDLATETRLFVDDAFWEKGSVDALLTAPYSFVSPRLAAHYGLRSVPGAPGSFVRVDLDHSRRSGILTQGSILAIHAKVDQSSPIHRGKFVRERLLCDALPPPPNDVLIVAPDVRPGSSTRERFDQHARDPKCAGCHKLMDPIGFAFEHYDGIGRWRADDDGRAVDARGKLWGVGADPDVDGAIELGRVLARSDKVRACITTQWFRFAYGRGETPADRCTLGRLRALAGGEAFDFQKLLLALTRVDPFRYRPRLAAAAPATTASSAPAGMTEGSGR